MYGVNPLRRKVLITTDEVVFHAPTNNDVDIRSILQSIIIAEERFIRPMLGSGLYEKLADAKNVMVDSLNLTNMTTLVNEDRPADREIITLVAGDYVNSDDYLDTKQKDLWQKHLHKIVAECVFFCALPVNRTRFGKTGVTQENPKSQVGTGGAATIDLKDLKHLMDRTLQDRISPLMEAMHVFMCTTSFPGYTRDCGCDSNGIPYKKKSDIVLSMYEDDQDCRCKWPFGKQW